MELQCVAEWLEIEGWLALEWIKAHLSMYEWVRLYLCHVHVACQGSVASLPTLEPHNGPAR